MIVTVGREQIRQAERIECLTRNRDAIADYFDTVLHVEAANAALSSPSRTTR